MADNLSGYLLVKGCCMIQLKITLLGTLRCEVILEAALDRVRKKSNVPIHFVASAKVGVTIAIPLEAIGDLSEAKCLEYARANGISIAYGKIRSIIESITAESLVGKQTIPPIDPYMLLERDSANEDQDS